MASNNSDDETEQMESYIESAVERGIDEAHSELVSENEWLRNRVYELECRLVEVGRKALGDIGAANVIAGDALEARRIALLQEMGEHVDARLAKLMADHKSVLEEFKRRDSPSESTDVSGTD